MRTVRERGLPRRALCPRWDRPLTAETRRIVHDAATAGLSLIDLDRPRADGPAAHDRPHCLAVEIIALRQVVDSDQSHGNLCAGVRLLAARGRPAGTIGHGHPEAEVRDDAMDRCREALRLRGASWMHSSVAGRPTDCARAVVRRPSIPTCRKLRTELPAKAIFISLSIT